MVYQQKDNVKKTKSEVIINTIKRIIRVIFTFYYIITISLRLSFRIDIKYNNKNNILYYILIDYLVDIFFWFNVLIRYFDHIVNYDKVIPNDISNDIRRVSKFRLPSRMGTMTNMRERSRRSRNGIVPDDVDDDDVVDDDEKRSSSLSPGGKLWRTLSSMSDNDIFRDNDDQQDKKIRGQNDDQDDDNKNKNRLSNFHKNQENHDMLISLKHSSTSKEKRNYLNDFCDFIMLFPFEIFGYLLGYQHYYHLRSFRALRIIRIPSYFVGITRILEDAELIMSASARRVVYLTIFMIFFAHIGACCFYALGLYLLDNGVQDVWLTYDGIVSLSDDGQEYYFNDPLGYRYVRVLYWAVVTSQTVGFGDVHPRSIQETSFCLLFFYMSHILCAQLAIGNLLLLFDVNDQAQTQYKERIEQLEIYSQFRRLPTELKDRITCYYHHQWKVLRGLDENELLRELPNNIRMKVKQATIRKLLLQVPFLRKLKMVVLNALTENVKSILYSPSDVIVPIESMSTGMYIISRGEAFVSSARSIHSLKKDKAQLDIEKDTEVNNVKEGNEKEDDRDSNSSSNSPQQSQSNSTSPTVITQTLKEGNCFGVKGLVEKYEHTLSLNAGNAVCEVLYLSRVRFQRTISILLTPEEAKPFRKNHPAFRKIANNDMSKNSTIESEGDGHNRTVSYIRASEVLNMDNSKASPIALRLKSDGDMRTAWDVLIFFGIAFYSVAIPINLSHSFKHQLLTKHIVLFSFGFIVDVIFFLDTCARMFLFPEFHKSVLMTSPKNIFLAYKQNYPLLMEILSIIPFDFIAVMDPNLLPVLRIFKIYHLVKFQEYSRIAEKAMAKYLKFSLSFSTSRLLRLQVGLFESCHWAACMWQLVAEISTNVLNSDVNWKIQDRDTDYLSIKYSSTLDNFTAYIRSLYWAINALSTSGVADMPSSNLVEMLFVCFALLLGCQLINAVLGSIASMMGNINKSKSDFSNKMDTVKRYMKLKRLPMPLQLKIQFFYEYNFQRTQGVDEMKLLAGLPQPLREDVVAFVVGSVVIQIPFFKHCSEPMLEMILGLLTRRCFLNMDDVVVAGEYGTEFFIIESGLIFVTSADKNTVYARLRNGSYIGESCLLKVAQRTASAHARDYSETYVLKKTDFENVVDVFPEDGEIAKKEILDLLNLHNEENKRLDTRKSRRSMMANFSRLPSIQSLDTSGLSLWHAFLEEFSYINKLWQCLLLFILLYNIFMIPLRLAFNKDSFVLLYAVDYVFDVLLWIDSYLKANLFRRIVGGKKLTNKFEIWRNYKATDLKYDALARFPYDILAVFFLADTTAESPLFILAFLRLPRMFLLLKGSDFLSAAEYVIEKAKISFFGLRMLQVLVSCLLVGHCLGCGLYVFQKAHYGESCVNEADAYYGEGCKYRDTWIQFLIFSGKLPIDGGSAFARYVRCINWAIPTMVLYTVGDVYPMNVNETAYIFAAMFIGVPVNAMIVGTIIALVTQVDDQSADILMKSDTLCESLSENNADNSLIEKVTRFIKFLVSDKGMLLSKENDIIEELPHTLQLRLCLHLKENFLRNCPFFDHIPDDAIQKLCLVMEQHIYYTGDYIAIHGDTGHEMFFIESGQCEVLSWDKRTVLAELRPGSYMGETTFFGLVDHSNKYLCLENIRATAITVCYVLKKKHFDQEMALFADGIDADKRNESLEKLRNGHCKRYAILLRNLKVAEDSRSKLYRVLGSILAETTRNAWLDVIAPGSTFRVIVDVIGYFFMLYYAFVIPFEISFLHKDISSYHTILSYDYVVDALCAVELCLRLFIFPLAEEKGENYEKKSTVLYESRFDSVVDICASIPIEIIVLSPYVSLGKIFFLRVIHLLRLSKLFRRTNQMEEHLFHIGVTLHFTTLAIIRGILVYFLGNHWLACFFFAFHRYFERNKENTWVVVDGHATYDEETQQHNICNDDVLVCYQRAIYFVGTVLTSVGYGDVSPITTAEMICQIWFAIVCACMGANICGHMTSYLKLGDRTGEIYFKEKLKSVEHYCAYRKLSPDLALSLIANYHMMWNKERRVGTKKTSFMHALSAGLIGDVALALNRKVMDVVPLFEACRSSLLPRLAYILKPQICLPDTSIYTVGDNSRNFFVILSGAVMVTATPKDSNMDELLLSALSILEQKHSYLRNIHESGHHFGEYALSSELSIRCDRAIATQLTEIYAIDRDDLWSKVFLRMPSREQFVFLKTIFSTVGGYGYLHNEKELYSSVKKMPNRYYKSLTQLVSVVIDNISEVVMSRRFSQNEDSDSLPSTMESPRKQVAVRKVQSTMSKMNFELSDDKSDNDDMY